MGFLSSAFQTRRATTARPQSHYLSTGWGGYSAAGVSVSEEGALRYSAVYACVRVLAESVASLPLITYRRLNGGGKERATNHPLYRLWHESPNPLMTSFEFRETMQAHLLLWGNAYAEIEMDGAGQVAALWPLRPDEMVKVELAGDWPVYTYRLPDGKTTTLPGWKVFHLRGMSGNGLIGYSPIQTVARETVGKALAVQQYGSLFFRNGARPGGILTFPGELSQEAMGRIRESWSEHYGGLSNSHRVAVLEQGMTYTEVGIAPADAAYIEDQKMSALDIARIFRVPPHMIGDLDRATFSNIEHQSIEFVTHSLRPWLRRWEEAIMQRLMSEKDRRKYLVEFLVEGLLRGDTMSRYQAYSVARQNGWLSANDIRELENLNPIENGDIYLVPLNMVPAEQAGEVQAEPQAAPAGRNTRDERRETKEARAAANGRVGIMRSQRAVFEDVMGRVCRRQAQDILLYARKLIKRDMGTMSLMVWLPEFLREHGEWTKKAVRPLYRSYGQLIAQEALGEIGAEGWDAEAWTDEEVNRFVSWHIAKTQRKVEAAAIDPDPLTALEAATALWIAEWPGYLAVKETVQAANSAARDVYRQNGVRELVWQTTFGDKSCHYCESLDGKVVGIEGKFDIPGLPPFRSVAYPPAHEGCECVVVARMATE